MSLCVCVCVRVCPNGCTYIVETALCGYFKNPTPPPQMMSLAEDLIKRLDGSHDQTLSEEEFLAYYSKKMGHVYTKNEVHHWRSCPGLVQRSSTSCLVYTSVTVRHLVLHSKVMSSSYPWCIKTAASLLATYLITPPSSPLLPLSLRFPSL